ncbi:40S ribosomal protein S5-1 [Hordeum vulgare]|nr:40S ribosomal protein S5-1 [Hordeum vulgare]
MVINPYLPKVMNHPHTIEMREGVLHIRDVQGPKKTGTVEARLEAVEQEIFRCQGLVKRGFSSNHLMVTEFTHDQKDDMASPASRASTGFSREPINRPSPRVAFASEVLKILS